MTVEHHDERTTTEVTLVLPEIAPPLPTAAAAELLALLLEASDASDTQTDARAAA